MNSKNIIIIFTILIMVECKHQKKQPRYIYNQDTEVQNYDNDYENNPKYQYSYHVENDKTGDYKKHEEQRDGDVVKGEYSLLGPDGSIRIVKYTVDKDSGFNAVVSIKSQHQQQQEYRKL